MEDHLLPDVPWFRIYQLRSVFIGTFIGGPLIAGYLVAENFKQLGEPGKMKNTWIIAISATVLLFAVIFLFPGSDKIPAPVIPVAYSGIAQLLAEKYQGKEVRRHMEAGGRFYSSWRAVWIGLTGFLLMLAIILIILLVVNNEGLV